jgi:hypothetical protein
MIGNALVAEDDRGCVLVASAHLDFVLRELLASCFAWGVLNLKKARPNLVEAIQAAFNPNDRGAVLSDLYPKTRIAYLMGLIDLDTAQALNKVRDIRNRFAHFPGTVVLTEDEIRALVGELDDWGKRWVAKSPQQDGSPSEVFRGLAGGQVFSDIRLRFMAAVMAIWYRLRRDLHELEDVYGKGAVTPNAISPPAPPLNGIPSTPERKQPTAPQGVTSPTPPKPDLE